MSSDYGSTWANQTSTRKWYSISLSSSGQYQSAVVFDGNIWTSSDYGNNWTSKATSISWYSISLSSSGQYQSAVVNPGNIWTSSDYGNTWTQNTSIASSKAWQSISLSSSGQYQSAVVNPGNIWTSSDYGVTWGSAATSLSWMSISLSSSGQYQSAVVLVGGIYYSSNYGKNWTLSGAPSKNWFSISLSSSGQYQSAAATVGGIYTNNNTIAFGLGSTALSVSTTQNNPRDCPTNFYQVFYYAPTGSNTPYLVYNTESHKTFVIDHPCDQDKYLVHACLEGPEAGVYYRGEGKITNNFNTIIELPNYVDKLATDFTVNLTPIYDEKTIDNINLKSSRVKNNKFTVYGPNCEFFWTVYGNRGNINVEPLKSETDVKGSGPYKWI
jgi:hypothetical protein